MCYGRCRDRKGSKSKVLSTLFSAIFFFVFSVGVGFSSEFEDEELASLCSPIPFRGSFARNKNAIAFSLFFSVCFEVGIGFVSLAHPF